MALFAEQTHDRLGITLIIAFIIHAVVIFAIKFDDLVKQNPVKTTRLEVTLAKRPSAKTPDEFDYLAQANQEGGGESDESDRPTDNNTAITPDVSTGAAPFQSAPKPAPDIPEEKRYIKTQGDDPSQTVQPQDDVTPVDPVPPAEIEYKQMDTAQLEALYYKQKEAYAKRNRIKSINANTKKAIYAS